MQFMMNSMAQAFQGVGNALWAMANGMQTPTQPAFAPHTTPMALAFPPTPVTPDHAVPTTTITEVEEPAYPPPPPTPMPDIEQTTLSGTKAKAKANKSDRSSFHDTAFVDDAPEPGPTTSSSSRPEPEKRPAEFSTTNEKRLRASPPPPPAVPSTASSSEPPAPPAPPMPPLSPLQLFEVNEASQHLSRNAHTNMDPQVINQFALYMYRANFDWKWHCQHVPELCFMLDNGQPSWRLQLSYMPGPNMMNLWDNKRDALRLFHSTTPKGLTEILRTKKLSCFSWDEGGAGDHGVYMKGFKATWTNYDDEDVKRVLNRVHSMAKNIAGLVVEASAVVETRSLRSGGIEAEVEVVRPGIATHMVKDKRWCVHPDDLKIEAIWRLHSGPLVS